ncbi:glycoside hydrolase family 30 protein [Peniophora sp. CONT]|nr:glycoside hydrolase family 30 protein [Peniophora sp. CONT]
MFGGPQRVLALTTGAYAATISTTPLQTVNGFGASGAWWVKDLALFPAEVRQNVSELLLNQTSGLGLTDYRYNLGGGGVGVGTWDRAPETPYISDGVYDFSADEPGTFFLREAARHGVPIITLFVNSAPTTFTNNSQNCGGTLIDERIPAYGQYIADVVSYWATQGVNITHVSPMNEPDNNFDDGDPTTLCGQEGMQVTPQQRAAVVSALHIAFTNASLSTQIIADESSSTGIFTGDAPIWLSPTVGSEIAAVAHHQYSFSSASAQANMTALAKRLSGGTPTWFTEICCYAPTDGTGASNIDPLATIGWGQQFDPTMVGGLRMGNLIYQSLVDAGDAHWDWWTALSNGLGSCSPSSGDADCVNEVNEEGWDDGIIYYDPDFNSTGYYGISLTKRFWVLKHFARAAPIGSSLLTVSTSANETDWRTMAFTAPGSSDLHAIVAMNMQWNASTLSLTLDGAELPAVSSAFRSSVNEDWASVTLDVADGALVVNAPEMSIHTIFF